MNHDANQISKKISQMTPAKPVAKPKAGTNAGDEAVLRARQAVPNGAVIPSNGAGTSAQVLPTSGTLPSLSDEDTDGEESDGEWPTLDERFNDEKAVRRMPQAAPTSPTKKTKGTGKPPVPAGPAVAVGKIGSVEYLRNRQAAIAELESEIFPMKTEMYMETIVEVFPVFAKYTQLLDEGDNIRPATDFYVGSNLSLASSFVEFDHESLRVPAHEHKTFRYKVYGAFNPMVQMRSSFGKFDEDGKLLITNVTLKPKHISKNGFAGVFRNVFVGWIQILKRQALPMVPESDKPDAAYWEAHRKPTPEWAAPRYAFRIAEMGMDFFYGSDDESEAGDKKIDDPGTDKVTVVATPSEEQVVPEKPRVEMATIELVPENQETPQRGQPPSAPLRMVPAIDSGTKRERLLGSTHHSLAYQAMQLSSRNNANRRLNFDFEEDVINKKGYNKFSTSFTFSNSAIFNPIEQPKKGQKPQGKALMRNHIAITPAKKRKNRR